MKISRTTLAIALSGTLALASSAIQATPISGGSLQSLLDGITLGGTSSIDVNADQYGPDAVWTQTASGISTARILFEIAGYKNVNSFGIYDARDPSRRLEIFSGPNGPGSVSLVLDLGSNDKGAITFSSTILPIGTDTASFTTDMFGFYLETPNNIWYSEDHRNADGKDHMVTFAGNNSDQISVPGFFGLPTGYNPWTDKEFILAWEDLPASSSDDDYDDFVVLVSNIMSVPEPGTLAIAGAGLLAFGFGMRLRRRS